MRKHLGWYCKGFPHAAALRARMFQASCVHDVEESLRDYCAQRTVEEPTALPDADASADLVSRCS
jgi:hypothetical protein